MARVDNAVSHNSSGRLSLLGLALILMSIGEVSSETRCDLLPPMESKEGPEFGMILVPGDTLVGETYRPLSMALQG